MTHEGKYYLTKEGLKKLKKEYNELIEKRKENLKNGAPQFLHSEEMSAEFISFKEENDYLRAQIENLGHILNNYQIIKAPPKKDRDKVFIGAKVKFEHNGKEEEFMIVGTFEADPANGKISHQSPVGKALLGHKVGDKVSVGDSNKKTYKIKSIKY